MSEHVSGIGIHYHDDGPRVEAELVTTTPNLGPYYTLTIGPVTYYLPLGEVAQKLGHALVIAGARLMESPDVTESAPEKELVPA